MFTCITNHRIWWNINFDLFVNDQSELLVLEMLNLITVYITTEFGSNIICHLAVFLCDWFS